MTDDTSSTGQYLQVCEYSAIFNCLVAQSIVKFIMIMLKKLEYFVLKEKTRASMINLTIIVATSDNKNSPVFTDLQIQACKTFIALATGVLQSTFH